MEIAYPKRSTFLNTCKSEIDGRRDELVGGQTIEISLGVRGYEASVELGVDLDNQSTFSTDWNNTDPSRFPARIKAAALALFELRMAGRFRIAHHDGTLAITCLTTIPHNTQANGKTSAQTLTATQVSHSCKGESMNSSTEVYFVSCVGQKRESPTRARELYTSAWFEKARAYVERRGAQWYILSAEHHLVPPDQELAPYERTLNNMKLRDRAVWGEKVFSQIESALPNLKLATFLAGERYREFLVPKLEAKGVRVEVPMQGLKIGEQLSWLTKNR